VICAASGQRWKPTRRVRDLIPIGRNQPRNVEKVVFKWVITEDRSPEYPRSTKFETQLSAPSVEAISCSVKVHKWRLKLDCPQWIIYSLPEVQVSLLRTKLCSVGNFLTFLLLGIMEKTVLQEIEC
jgi:hypothetical protein